MRDQRRTARALLDEMRYDPPKGELELLDLLERMDLVLVPARDWYASLEEW